MSKFPSVKDNDFIDGICTLAKNTPKLVFPKYNNKTFIIHEKATNETLYIIFNLNKGEQALIGKECHSTPKGCPERRKTDLMCVYRKPTHEIGYTYDLKRTIGGKDVILHLISQWTETISYCKSQIKNSDYEFVVGIITEEFNRRLLDNDIKELSEYVEEPSGFALKSSLAARKKLISDIECQKALNRLIEFKTGKFKIGGLVLDIDIQFFENIDDKKELTLLFNGDGGNSKPQVLRHAVQ